MLIHHALTQTRYAQDAALDDGFQIESLAQVGDDGAIHQVIHLARHAGQTDHHTLARIHNERRRSANRIRNSDRVGRTIGLAFVVVGHLATHDAEPLFDLD